MIEAISNRNIPVKGIERMLGDTLSAIPTRITIDDAKDVISILQRVQENHIASLAHSHANLVDMKKWSGTSGELLDVLFVFQQSDAPKSAAKEHLPFVEELRATANYTVEVELSVINHLQCVNLGYDGDRISRTQVYLMMKEFQFTLGQVCDAVSSDGLASIMWELSPGQRQKTQDSSFHPDIPLPYELLERASNERAIA
ncbi:hypothetical protein Ae201684_017962 [Aphanomyces euteiches]|uniref:Condensation domain-containing protein n=1 Tax=Aphanomyces euteiches TaxID=100861 RepID=A0A6G0W7Q5_9STRA|nr:hypothetical protein Ae201684_017962 [Aphanomyces euteiches]